jgi:hypothetical protein
VISGNHPYGITCGLYESCVNTRTIIYGRLQYTVPHYIQQHIQGTISAADHLHQFIIELAFLLKEICLLFEGKISL